MGAILKTKTLTTLTESLILIVGLAVILGGVYWFAPGLRVGSSKQLKSLALSSDNINNEAKGSLLPLPSTAVSTKVANKPLARIAEYAWNGNSGMIVANGSNPIDCSTSKKNKIFKKIFGGLKFSPYLCIHKF